MHNLKIVHIDLKHQNILLKFQPSEGRAQGQNKLSYWDIHLADFGYSRFYIEQDKEGDFTKKNIDMESLAGAPVFMTLEVRFSALGDAIAFTRQGRNTNYVRELPPEVDPGAPKLTLSHSRKKSLQRKSSIRRIVSSFSTNKSSIMKEAPPPPSPSSPFKPLEGRLTRLETAISSAERQNTQFLLWSPEALQGWVEIELGLPESVGEAVRLQCRTVSMFLSMGERDYEQELGILQPLVRLKLTKVVQERVTLSKASTPYLYSPYRGINPQWIASHWLPSLGISQYNNNFRRCCVDGRVLEHLTKKELCTSLGMVESSHRNSLQFGIIALGYLNYDRQSPEEKQRQSVTGKMSFWSNGQVAKWLHAIRLGNYTANIDSSGLHGAVLYFDISHDYHEITITLQISHLDSVARKILESFLHELLCQPSASNLDKKGRRKSFALFHRKSPEPPQSPDLPTPGSTASRDEMSGSGSVLRGQIDLRSLLEEVHQRGRGSSLSIGAASRSRSSSLTGSEKKLTERLNTELCRLKEQKDSLTMKVIDLKAENQSISEKLLRENRQNQIHRAEIQELQRRYEQSVNRLERKEEETIRLNGELDRIKSEGDNRGNVSDDITAFEGENPFSSQLSGQWSLTQDVTPCVHDENSFTMVSELTDPTLAGLSTSLAVNDTNAVFQAQLDETITSNIPPRIVPYSVQDPSPELETDESVPQQSLQSAVSRLKEGREQLEQELQSAKLDDSERRTQLSQASERRPVSQLFERISQMETEKQKLITENDQLRDEIKYRCPSGGEGLQEKNQHLSSKLAEAVKLLESNNKEKESLIFSLFGPEANTAATMSEVTRRMDQILLVLNERVLEAETENVELTQHLTDMMSERDTRQQAVTQTETVCRELELQCEKLTLVKVQLETELEDISTELLLAKEGYREVVEEKDDLALLNKQIMAQCQDAMDCKERVEEKYAATLTQMDDFWRLNINLKTPRFRTPTHIWGEGWDRKTLVLQLSSKKDPDIYLAGGRDQPLLPNPNAVIVVDVLPSSPVCHLLQPGDIIESIDGCDCSILTKKEVIRKMLGSIDSSPEVVLLWKKDHTSSSSRNQLSAYASFPGSRSLCLTPEPSEFMLDSKISQVSLTSSLTSHTDLQKLVNRASNPLVHSINSQLRTEQMDIVLLASRDSKKEFGLSYYWESQFIVSAMTKTGTANSQLTPGDKIIKVNGVSVLQAKPSSFKRLIKNNKNVLKLSIVRSVIPGSSNIHLANQDIFSDTEAIENSIPQKKANLLAQEKIYYSVGELNTEVKGFLRNRLSLKRSKKGRKSSVPVPVESDTEEPHPPIDPVSALSKKQSSFRDDLEPHREEPQTRVKIQSHTPTQLELSCEENRVNSPRFLLARNASRRTVFRSLPDLDRKLANKRHSLTSAPVINCSTCENTEAIQPEYVSRSAEVFTLKNKHSQVSGSVGETILAAQERHRTQSKLGLGPDNTLFPPFRSISSISLQRSITEKKTTDHLTGESSDIDSFLDEARSLNCPEQQVPLLGWQDTPLVPEFIGANFTIQSHNFLTVTEGAVYQILETPSQLTGFMLVAPVFSEEMYVKEGYIPTENTGKEMLQNLKPTVDLGKLRLYSPVKLYRDHRPVLIFGPLSGEIGMELGKAYNSEVVFCPDSFVLANNKLMKDQLCKDIAKGLILDLTVNSRKNYAFFELDNIQLHIDNNKHSILNSSPKIIGQLEEKGIPPISILIKARSHNTIMSVSSRNLTETDCIQMFQAFEHIEVDLEPILHASIMLVKMPLLVEQIREVIQQEQNHPVWMTV